MIDKRDRQSPMTLQARFQEKVFGKSINRQNFEETVQNYIA